ncbi:hypothetical protein [Ruegeria jejuensis]|uniref:hypothetical protein n=1 Tax=Ruegeria jejuensis TaxID=3233338 RepID=UPI00355B40FD
MRKWWSRLRKRSARAGQSATSSAHYDLGLSSGKSADQIVGLSVREYGRMGNNLLQVSSALLLARSLGLQYVQVPNTELIKIEAQKTVKGLTFLPPSYNTQKLGGFLTSNFYQGPRLERLGIRMPERRKILKKYLVEAANIPLPQAEPEGCLTIHLRSGDAFKKDPHPDFAQPPLAFYQMAIDDARESQKINRVRLVYEDTRNPCVEALQTYLKQTGLTVLLQSGTLHEDLSVLMSARHLTFGYGTFGVGVCLLSDAAETVRVFGASGPAYEQFDHLTSTEAWGDISGRYPRIGEWKASQDQLDLMLQLPKKEIGPLDLSASAQIRAPDWWTLPDTEI